VSLNEISLDLQRFLKNPGYAEMYNRIILIHPRCTFPFYQLVL